MLSIWVFGFRMLYTLGFHSCMYRYDLSFSGLVYFYGFAGICEAKDLKGGWFWSRFFNRDGGGG